MATALEVARALSQIMALSHDGALDENDDPIQIGLKREEGVSINDCRVIDGFKVKLHGNNLIINYQCEMLTRQTHDKKFESDVQSTINEIVKFLKKEYKKVAGESLTLKGDGKLKVEMYDTSRVRMWLQAECLYEIGNLKGSKVKNGEELLDKATKDWLKLGKNDKGFH